MPAQGDIDSILNTITPRERSVELCLRGDLAASLEDLFERWKAAKTADLEANSNNLGGGRDTAGPLYDELAEMREEAARHTATFRVVSIGSEWRRLSREHPPEGDDFVENYRWNMSTFPPAALSASVADPQMTPDQARVLLERLADGQFAALWNAVTLVNMGEDVLPKSVSGTDVTPTSGETSTTAPLEESP